MLTPRNFDFWFTPSLHQGRSFVPSLSPASTQIRLGVVVDVSGAEDVIDSPPSAHPSIHGDHVDDAGSQHGSDSQNIQTVVAMSEVESFGQGKVPSRRVGFGVMYQVQPFRNRTVDEGISAHSEHGLEEALVYG